MNGSTEDYVAILVAEFADRRLKNPEYSWRAYARDLQLSAPYLHQVVKGQRKLSVNKAASILPKLRFNKKRGQLFVKLVAMSSYRTFEQKVETLREIDELGLAKVFEQHQLQLDQFSFVSDWYYFAIMELTEVDGFQVSSQNIAKRLRIDHDIARDALSRLTRLGLLVNERGLFTKISKQYGIRDVPSAAIRKFHYSHLQKAAKALREQDHSRRDFSGASLAIDPAQLPELKIAIREFRNKIHRLTDLGAKKKNVYHLAIQLYQLDLGD